MPHSGPKYKNFSSASSTSATDKMSIEKQDRYGGRERQASRPIVLMVTEECEWDYVLTVMKPKHLKESSDKNVMLNLEYRKRHIMFPPIIAGQFIPGSPEFIPVYHDSIKNND